MKKYYLLILMIFSSASTLLSQNPFDQYEEAKKNAIGKLVPDLAFETMINTKADKLVSQKSLAGKVVILEFWTTWCAPCIKQFPKINDLANSYKESEVVFISITPETPDIVEPFLKRRTLETWIGLDTDNSVIDYFGVYAYPTTIVIDKSGKVLEYIKPQQLNSEYINNLLSGNSPVKETEAKKELSGPMLSMGNSNTEKNEKATEPIYKVLIEDTEATGGMAMVSKDFGFMKVQSWSLKEALAFSSHSSKYLIKGPEDLLNKRVSIDLKLPKGKPELVEELISSALKNKFSFETSIKNTPTEIYEMVAPDGVSKNLYQTKSESGHFSTDEGILAASKWQISAIVSAVEDALKMRVLDKTNLTEKYDFNLYWDHENPASIIEALESQLGLVLRKKTLPMDVVEVSPKQGN